MAEILGLSERRKSSLWQILSLARALPQRLASLPMKPRIAVCASGTGSNFSAIVAAAQAGSLGAEVVGLICNRPKAGVVGRAKLAKIPCRLLAPKDFSKREAWDAAMVTQLQKWQADWVVLAGFLLLVGPQLLAAYPRRIVNSHPSLLPKYGGAGMYGDNVHVSVLGAGEQESGVTIHLIDSRYDQGQILAQQKVPVLPGDTFASLAERVKTAEHQFYPRVLSDLVSGRLTIS